MDINPITLGIFTLAGSVVGAAASAAVAWLNRRAEDHRHELNRVYDDRRHLREIAIKTAMDYWTKQVEFLKEKGERMQRNILIPPPDPFVVHMLLLVEMVTDKKLTALNAEDELRRIREVSNAAQKAGEPKNEAGE